MSDEKKLIRAMYPDEPMIRRNLFRIADVARTQQKAEILELIDKWDVKYLPPTSDGQVQELKSAIEEMKQNE